MTVEDVGITWEMGISPLWRGRAPACAGVAGWLGRVTEGWVAGKW